MATVVLVESAAPAASAAGCGSAGGFGGGALLALPVILAALVLRRFGRRGARR
jgi:uncharacterized protein (TIGR03382 family)